MFFLKYFVSIYVEKDWLELKAIVCLLITASCFSIYTADTTAGTSK